MRESAEAPPRKIRRGSNTARRACGGAFLLVLFKLLVVESTTSSRFLNVFFFCFFFLCPHFLIIIRGYENLQTTCFGRNVAFALSLAPRFGASCSYASGDHFHQDSGENSFVAVGAREG